MWNYWLIIRRFLSNYLWFLIILIKSRLLSISSWSRSYEFVLGWSISITESNSLISGRLYCIIIDHIVIGTRWDNFITSILGLMLESESWFTLSKLMQFLVGVWTWHFSSKFWIIHLHLGNVDLLIVFSTDSKSYSLRWGLVLLLLNILICWQTFLEVGSRAR